MNATETTIVKAIKEMENACIGNTQITYSVTEDKTEVHLHGSKIVEYFHDKNQLKVNFCGFVTNVTVSRINSIIEALDFDTHFNIKSKEIHKSVLKAKFGIVESNGWLSITE